MSKIVGKRKQVVAEMTDGEESNPKRLTANNGFHSAPLSEDSTQQKVEEMSKAVRTLLQCIGEDPDREGLLKTPQRVAKALLFFTQGYDAQLETVVNEAVFHEDHKGIVVVRDIEISSMCEHHMIPFLGKVHIGYLPDQKVIGLSKLARIAEIYSRRLQVQERLTDQIAHALMESVQPKGVAVVVECCHMCMVMRGVQKVGACTTTSSYLGDFETDSTLRAEFLGHIRAGK